MRYLRFVPNALTLLRVALCPAIVAAVFDDRLGLAVSLFVFAALTDFADGWVARHYHAVTRLGEFLDPLADKGMMLTLFSLLLYLHSCPTWFFALLVSAYLFQSAGFLLLYFSTHQEATPTPVRLGKWNLALQLLWVGVALGDLWLQRALPRNFRHSVMFHNSGYFVLAALELAVLWVYFQRFRLQLTTELRALPPSDNRRSRV